MNAIAKSFPGGAAGSNERRQLILLGALSLVLVLLLVWQVPKLLGGSGSSSEAAPGRLGGGRLGGCSDDRRHGAGRCGSDRARPPGALRAGSSVSPRGIRSFR